MVLILFLLCHCVDVIVQTNDEEDGIRYQKFILPICASVDTESRHEISLLLDLKLTPVADIPVFGPVTFG